MDSFINSERAHLGSLDTSFSTTFNATWASNFTHEVLCHTEIAVIAAAVFGLMLDMRVVNTTLKQWLLNVDIQAWTTHMNTTINELEGWDASAIVSNLANHRDDFLASDL